MMYAKGLKTSNIAKRATMPQMTSTLTDDYTITNGPSYADEMNLTYVIPHDVKKRVIDIPNDFKGHDKNQFELTEEENEMVQAVLISNDEIKARCAEMAK